MPPKSQVIHYRPGTYTAAQLLVDLQQALALKPHIADIPIRVAISRNPVRLALSLEGDAFTVIGQA